MKKQFVLFAMAAVLCVSSACAQQEKAAMPRMTAEDRTKATIEKLAPLNLTADQTTKATAVFNTFFATQQKAIEEMRAGGSIDREAMKTKRDEMVKKRDAELQAIFTPEQYKKYSEEIESSLRARPMKKQE